MHRPLKLKSTIGRHDVVEPEDVLAMKIALNWTGFYDIPDYGLTSTPDEPMFKAIEKFQSEKGLSKDGVVRPEGQTADALNLVLERSATEKKPPMPPKPKCPEGQYPLPKTTCIPGTSICVTRYECTPYRGPTGPRG